MYHLQVPLGKMGVEKFQGGGGGGVEIFLGGVAIFSGGVQIFSGGVEIFFLGGGVRNFRGVEKLY